MSFPLIAIVGPTAVGKSKLAFKLAQCFNGEILNADSRQVYRHMDIGTAKPSLAMRTQIPHHLIDIINPEDDFSLGQYKDLASKAVTDIHSRHKLPILTGGTGQYVWALLEGWTVPQVPPDTLIRESLEYDAKVRGPSALYEQLKQIDPVRASKIDPRNVRRVIRALEIHHLTNTMPSGLQKKIAPPWESLILGLTMNREELYQKADERIDKMVQAGWVEEVHRLLDMGYNSDLPSMSSLGYRDLIAHVKGEISLADAIQKIKWNTHRFIRHQYAWFRPTDSRINWLYANKNAGDTALQLVQEKYPDLHTICATI